MVDRLLRVFAPFRELESEVTAQRNFAALLSEENETLRAAATKYEAQATQLQDRLDAAYEDRQRLWDLVKTALEGERTAYQAHINIAWQKEGRSAPYPDAPQMPAHQVQREIPNSTIPRPMTMSERMEKGTQDFIQQYVTSLGNQ